MSGSTASLSFDIDSSQAQRAVSVLQTLVQQSQATLAATQGLKASTTDLSTAYAANAQELSRLADQTRNFGGTLGGLVTQLNALRTTFAATQGQFNQYTQMLTAAQGFALQMNTTVEGIDRFVSKAQQLNVTMQDLATPLTRITDALRGQSAEGNRLRTVFDSLRVSIDGLKTNQAADALLRLVAASREFRDDQGKVQAFAQFGVSPQDMLAMQRQPYQPMLEREQAQRDQEQRARVDQMQTNMARLAADMRNQRDLTADLGRKLTTDPSWLGRMGLSIGGGQGYFTSEQERQRRLEEIQRMSPEEQRPYQRYGYAAEQLYQQSYFPRLGRHYRSGEYSANENANAIQFQRETRESPYGLLSSVPRYIGREFLNAANLYEPPKDIMEDLRKTSPAEELRQRTEAADNLALLGQTRPQQLTALEVMQQRRAQPGTRGQYERFFGEDASRQMDFDSLKLIQAQRYTQRPEAALADQANQQRYLMSLAPTERQTAAEQLRMFQQLHQGIDPSALGVVPGRGLAAATGVGGGGPGGDAETAQRAEALRTQQDSLLQSQHENAQETIQLNHELAESLKEGQAAAADALRVQERYAEVLKLTNDPARAAKAAQDSLNVTMAQRITQGQSLITQIQSETAAINQRASDAQRYANADPIARAAYMAAGGLETEIQQRIRSGQLPNPAGSTVQPTDPWTGRPMGPAVATTPEQNADAARRVEQYRLERLQQMREQGTLTGEEIRGGLQQRMEGGQRVSELQAQGMPLQQAQQRVQLEQQIEAALAQETTTIAALANKTDEASVKAREDAEARQKGLEAIQHTVDAMQRQAGVQQEINNLLEKSRQLAQETATILAATEAPMWMRTLIQTISAGLSGLANAGAGPGPATSGGGAQANISGVYGFIAGQETGGGVTGRGQDINTRILNPLTGLPKSTASGFLQVIDSTWQEGMKKAGFSAEDIAKYPRALGAPPEIQARVWSVTPLGAWKSSEPGKPGAADLLIAQHPNLNMSMPLSQVATTLGEPALPTITMTQPGGPVVPSPTVAGGAAGAQVAGLLPEAEQAEAARILAEGDLPAGWHGKTPEQIKLLNDYGRRERERNTAGVGLSLANLRARIQAEIAASNRRIQAAPQGPGYQRRAGIVDDPSIPPELRTQERQIREDQLRQQQREGAATEGADQQHQIEQQRRRLETYSGGLAEQLAKQRELDAQFVVDEEVRKNTADAMDVQAAKSRALVQVLQSETEAVLKHTQQLQTQVKSAKAAAAASVGGPDEVKRAEDLFQVYKQLESLEITRSKTTDTAVLQRIDAETAALQKQIQTYDQLSLAQARTQAGLQAYQMGRQDQVQAAVNATGPFATALDQDRARRYMELAQQFTAKPGLEQSDEGQRLLRANQQRDAIMEQTQAMNEYRESAHAAASAVEQAFMSVVDRSQTAGQAIHGLATALQKIALETFVIKPFEKLMDKAFQSIFGDTPAPGSLGDTTGKTGESVFGAAGRLMSGGAAQGTGGGLGKTVLSTAGGIITSASGNDNAATGGVPVVRIGADGKPVTPVGATDAQGNNIVGGTGTGGNTTGGTSTGGGDVNTGGGDVVNVGGAVNVAVNAATGGGMANCCCGGSGGLLGGATGGGGGGGDASTGPGLFGRIGNWIGDLFGSSTDGGKKNIAGGTTASGAGATSPDFFDRVGNWFGGLFGSNDNAAPGSTADIGNAIAAQTGLVTGANDNNAGGGFLSNASSGLLSFDTSGGDTGLSLGGGPRISSSSDVSGTDYVPAWQQAEMSGARAASAGLATFGSSGATGGDGGGLLGQAFQDVGKLATSGGGGGGGGGSSGGGGGGGGSSSSDSSGPGLLGRIFGHAGGISGWITDKILGEGMYKRGGLIGMISRDVFGSGSGDKAGGGKGGTAGGGTAGAGAGAGTGKTVSVSGPNRAGNGTVTTATTYTKDGETTTRTETLNDGTVTKTVTGIDGKTSTTTTAGPGQGAADQATGADTFSTTAEAAPGADTGAGISGIAGDTGLPPGVGGWLDQGRWDTTGTGTGAGTGGLASVDQTSTDISAGALGFGGDFGGAGLADQFGGGGGDFGGDMGGGFQGGGSDSFGGGDVGDFGGGMDNTFGSLDGGGLYAMGGVPGVERFARGGSTRRRRGGTRRFAYGGVSGTGLANLRNTVVEAPTVFRFAGGGAMGMAGEGGSEAILPLKRDGSGRLGVSAGNFGGGGGGHTFHTHNWNISTPDAHSFMRTRNQIENNLNMSMSKSRNRNTP